ncbi:MAG: hypothetical protein WBC92_01550 [Terracidiphilus sp.]
MQRTGLRIGLWVLSGAAVTCFWVLLALIAGPGHFDGHWTVVAITLPASLLWSTSPLAWYQVMFLNAFVYGLIGLAIEPFLRLRHSPDFKPELTGFPPK